MAADPDGESIFSGLGKVTSPPSRLPELHPVPCPLTKRGLYFKRSAILMLEPHPTGKTSFRWGEPFSNNEGYLPGSSGLPSRYSEYRVTPPPGIRGGGTLRVVVDHLSNNVWYTWTHYGTAGMPPFVLIR